MQNQILTTANRPLVIQSPQKCYMIKGADSIHNLQLSASKTDIMKNSRTADQVNLSASSRGQTSDQKQKPRSTVQEDVMFSITAEKSFNEASQKIWRIKQMELENRINLLTIENERLNNFLQSQIQETERLADELTSCQNLIERNHESYADKLNKMLSENQKLEDVNRRQEEQLEIAIRNNQMQCEAQIDQYRKMQVEPLTEKILKVEAQSNNIQNQMLQVQAHNDQLTQQMNILLEENAQLNEIFKAQERQKDNVSSLLKESQDQHQQTVEGFEQEVKEQRAIIEEMKRKHQNELKKVKSDTLNEMNEHVTELCHELDSKDHHIQALQAEIENSNKMSEFQRKRDQAQIEALKQQLQQEKEKFQREKNTLLDEIQQQQESGSRLEQNLISQSKILVQKENQIKVFQNELNKLHKEINRAQNQLKKNSEGQQEEVNTLKSQIDIQQSENDTLREEIQVLQREIELMNAKQQSRDLEFEQRLSVAVSEVHALRDDQLEQFYQQQVEVSREQSRQREFLEKRLQEQQLVRKALDAQIDHLKQCDSLADQKIKELLQLNEQLERDCMKYKEQSQKNTIETKSLKRKLANLEQQYGAEKNQLRQQVNDVADDVQQAFQERENAIKERDGRYFVLFQESRAQLAACQSELQSVKDANDRLNFEMKHVNERYKLIERDHQKLTDKYNELRLKVEDNRIEMKRTGEGFYSGGERELMNKVNEQSILIKSLTEKYQSAVKQNQSYKSQLKQYKESQQQSRDGESQSSRRNLQDNEYEDEQSQNSQGTFEKKSSQSQHTNNKYPQKYGSQFSSMGRTQSKQL